MVDTTIGLLCVIMAMLYKTDTRRISSCSRLTISAYFFCRCFDFPILFHQWYEKW